MVITLTHSQADDNIIIIGTFFIRVVTIFQNNFHVYFVQLYIRRMILGPFPSVAFDILEVLNSRATSSCYD